MICFGVFFCLFGFFLLHIPVLATCTTIWCTWCSLISVPHSASKAFVFSCSIFFFHNTFCLITVKKNNLWHNRHSPHPTLSSSDFPCLLTFHQNQSHPEKTGWACFQRLCVVHAIRWIFYRQWELIFTTAQAWQLRAIDTFVFTCLPLYWLQSENLGYCA